MPQVLKDHAGKRYKLVTIGNTTYRAYLKPGNCLFCQPLTVRTLQAKRGKGKGK